MPIPALAPGLRPLGAEGGLMVASVSVAEVELDDKARIDVHVVLKVGFEGKINLLVMAGFKKGVELLRIAMGLDATTVLLMVILLLCVCVTTIVAELTSVTVSAAEVDAVIEARLVVVMLEGGFEEGGKLELEEVLLLVVGIMIVFPGVVVDIGTVDIGTDDIGTVDVGTDDAGDDDVGDDVVGEDGAGAGNTPAGI
ncbi:hypothetical protein EG329_007655 [Mollisiaceae sp. DMI_Dod_QoI]|nr:hypothetical protein EG329_007655 [Helotiales sp. DMI_Dod_QoI]